MTAPAIQESLQQLLQFFDFKIDKIVVHEPKDNMTRVEMFSPEASRVIGWHGETLNSIQHLLKSIIRTAEKLERSPFIVLDIDGYRRTQEEKVCRIADQKADFVRRTGNRIALSPMSAYFRRIVHLYVAGNSALQDLTTESIGEGEYRQIILRLKDEKNSGSEELSPVIAGDDGLENLDI